MLGVAIFIATAAYVGYVRFAPGTAGSAAGMLLLASLRASGATPALELGTIAGLIVLGIWSGSLAERHFRWRDPGPVVIDEVVGMWITLALIPLTPAAIIAGFFLFRLADIVKPFPSARLEALPGGWGIMADDIVAGLYAHGCLRLVMLASPGALA